MAFVETVSVHVCPMMPAVPRLAPPEAVPLTLWAHRGGKSGVLEAGDPEGSADATASVAALVSVSSLPRVVGEGHLHRDGLALVGVSQGVGAGTHCAS